MQDNIEIEIRQDTPATDLLNNHEKSIAFLGKTEKAKLQRTLVLAQKFGVAKVSIDLSKENFPLTNVYFRDKPEAAAGADVLSRCNYLVALSDDKLNLLNHRNILTLIKTGKISEYELDAALKTTPTIFKILALEHVYYYLSSGLLRFSSLKNYFQQNNRILLNIINPDIYNIFISHCPPEYKLEDAMTKILSLSAEQYEFFAHPYAYVMVTSAVISIHTMWALEDESCKLAAKALPPANSCTNNGPLPPHLAQLPWELLTDPVCQRYVTRRKKHADIIKIILKNDAQEIKNIKDPELFELYENNTLSSFDQVVRFSLTQRSNLYSPIVKLKIREGGFTLTTALEATFDIEPYCDNHPNICYLQNNTDFKLAAIFNYSDAERKALLTSPIFDQTQILELLKKRLISAKESLNFGLPEIRLLTHNDIYRRLMDASCTAAQVLTLSGPKREVYLPITELRKIEERALEAQRRYDNQNGGCVMQ